MQAVNPATGEVESEYRDHTIAEAIEAVIGANNVQVAWADSPLADRSRAMRAAARILRDRRDLLAELMAREMGKPVSSGLAEVDKCAWVCEYYAENAAAFLSPQARSTDAEEAFVAFRPLGVVLAVMPWNFPLWQVFRFAAPALMAGNGGLLKHASNVPGCAIAIEDVFRSAGFPEGLFASLLIGSGDVAELIRHDGVAAVTLTGSEPAGRAVAEVAGSSLKKTVLELGGSDPAIVLEDADLDLAATTCAKARLINGGQSCIAAKRFIVMEEVYEPWLRGFTEAMAATRIGDPLDPETQLGPMARLDLRDELHEQVTKSVARGARIVLGGAVPPGPGAFYPPTVLVDVGPGQPAYEEELFGPVAAVIRVSDEAEAVRIANDTRFGLGASVFTGDIERGRRLATREIHAGAVFVNSLVASDPRLPFGGIKASGYGRELSEYGIREFVNVKTVSIA